MTAMTMDAISRERSAAVRIRGWIGRLVCLLVLVTSRPAAGEPVDVSRLIAIGGDIAEIVYALGVEDRLVAVDTTATYPPAARRLPNVGYMRNLSAEGILSLSPTLVLANKDAGPPPVLDQLRRAKVTLLSLPYDESPEGVVEKIRHVGRALGIHARADRLANLVAANFARVAEVRAVADRPRVLFIFSAGNGAPLAAGAESIPEKIIRLSGGENATAGFFGFKPLSSEAAVAAAPDYILVTDRTLDTLGGRDEMLRLPWVRLTPAGRAGQIVAMDGLYLLGFGPRSPNAVRDLAMTLHRGLNLPALPDIAQSEGRITGNPAR